MATNELGGVTRGMLALAVSNSQPDLLVPQPLKRGDIVGVVAASGPVLPDALEKGLRFLNRFGFRIRLGRHLHERNDYLAGTDRQRADDLNSMLSNPDVRGILFARGGYGVMRLIEDVRTEEIRQDPKILVGMSDLTALALSLYGRCRLMTWTGPMLAAQVGEGLDLLSEEWFSRALTEPVYERNLIPDNHPIRVLRPGGASGPLMGGCLSLITALLGTAHVPDLAGAVLLLEDVHEPLYRVDRMLTQLKLAGILDSVAGFVLGHFVDNESADRRLDVENILLGLIGDRSVPVVSAYPHGHDLPNLTLPHGAHVRLNADQAEVSARPGTARQSP
ncbi:MAG: LD-carboxypeptidase [Desulfomonile tiedjei]|nr:LD-carboxypeptidase [Desulfomonile tiedjei]